MRLVILLSITALCVLTAFMADQVSKLHLQVIAMDQRTQTIETEVLALHTKYDTLWNANAESWIWLFKTLGPLQEIRQSPKEQNYRELPGPLQEKDALPTIEVGWQTDNV